MRIHNLPLTILLVAFVIGCGESQSPTGRPATTRIVICDSEGAITNDLIFRADKEPSRKRLRSFVDQNAPSELPNGEFLKIVSASALTPSKEFTNAKSLAAFETSLEGSHSKFPAFIVINDPAAITVYRVDPDDWSAQPSIPQMTDPNHSDSWRATIVDKLIDSLQWNYKG